MSQNLSSSWYTRLCAQLLFPVHERLKGHDSVALHRALEASQWLSPEALVKLQTERLRDFLIEIGQRVPYYQSLFALHGFEPKRLQSVADLQALPMLTRSDVRNHATALRANGHGPLMRYSTGGSSGEPLVFHIGLARKSHDVAAKWRATRWWGVDIGDPELVVWGSPIELHTQDRIRHLRDGLLRSHLLPAFGLTPEKLDRYVAAIARARPAMLFGYPSSLALIAAHARERGVPLSRLGIRVVFVTGELLFAEQRELLSAVFGCPVANGYGARDAGFIAHECPAGGMHISAEELVLETVRPDGHHTAPGEPGEIVVTHLGTADFPFLRYRTGDVGVLSQSRCSCGRGLPLLAEVQGKSNHFVLAQDGSVLHAAALTHVLRDLPQIVQYQIWQTALDRIVLRVVAPPLDSATRARIVQGFKARLGAGVQVALEEVAEIAVAPSGKHRFVVSDLDALAHARSVGHA